MESFSFLVTTDNHMGYKEDDHLRRKDSYQAFREALEISRNKDVDFILLGGDLFHMNRPSASIEHKCIKIIRQHMNISNQTKQEASFVRKSGNFSHFHKINHANFEDPSLKVTYPIMTIHGNHDDPTGPNAQSICEKLATCGLLNYFGAVNQQSKEIIIEPIVLQKGSIKFALYGLGFIPDYKLKSAFDKGEVKFVDPPKDTFNILVVHQNRVPFAKTKVIPDEIFPKYFHLVIRGHEHATLAPIQLPDSNVGGIVYQPGSTVATSICPAEAAPKKVGLINVKLHGRCHNQTKGPGQKPLYKMDYELIELKSCRAMLFKDISQKEIFRFIKKSCGASKLTSAEYKRYSRECIEQSIESLLIDWKKSRVEKKGTEKDGLDDKLPLVRVRLEYVSRSEQFDDLEVMSRFYPNSIANRDIVLFKKQKLKTNDEGLQENVTFSNDDHDEDEPEDFDHINLSEEKRDTIDVMINNYFLSQPPEKRLQALSLIEYTNAVRGSSEDGNVISKVLSRKKQDMLNKFRGVVKGESDALERFHDEEAIKSWFLSSFAENDYQKIAGDYIDEIMLED